MSQILAIIVCCLIFGTTNADMDFYTGDVVPVLMKLKEVDSFSICQGRSQLFTQIQQEGYPDWVYEELNIPRQPITERNVSFWLYTRNNYAEGEQLKTYEGGLPDSSFDPKKQTVIFVQGQHRNHTEASEVIPSALLPKEDINIIIADYDSYTFYDGYYNRNTTVPRLAEILVKFINQLIGVGAKAADMYLIGFSVGGEVIALAGKQIEPKVGRILGFDPAGSCFSFLPPSQRISSTDASFVQIVHCTTGDHGHYKFLGNVTFYMNGGYVQPECANESVHEANECSHHECLKYFYDTIRDYYQYYGVRCGSYREYLIGNCDCKDSVVMGYATPNNISGIYYVNTQSPKPCKYENDFL